MNQRWTEACFYAACAACLVGCGDDLAATSTQSEDGSSESEAESEGGSGEATESAEGSGDEAAETSSTTGEVPVCGDGIVDPNESCDDANRIDGDGCSACCLSEVCGDGIRHSNADETCDDANELSNDGCDACTMEFCGDGIVQDSEGCDDANTQDNDGCSQRCEPERCGDGILQLGSTERCDDGNQSDGDGCTADCELEPSPFAELRVAKLEGVRTGDDPSFAAGWRCYSFSVCRADAFCYHFAPETDLLGALHSGEARFYEGGTLASPEPVRIDVGAGPNSLCPDPAPNIAAGSRLVVQHDGGQTQIVYLPEITSNIGLFVGADGSTYLEPSLTTLLQAAP